MHISIIIPVFNESSNIDSLLDHLKNFTSDNIEIIFVDGESSDNTSALLCSKSFVVKSVVVKSFVVFSCAKGRAIQMNLGAAKASGDIFLFLHADTRLPENFYSVIENALVTNNSNWGRFDVKIVGKSYLFPIISALMNCRSRQWGIATGDQAIFIKREAFESIGGFPEQALMEDVEFCKRLKKLSEPICLREKVITSGRRWEKNGVWNTIFLMWRLRWRYWRGADVNELVKLYQ